MRVTYQTKAFRSPCLPENQEITDFFLENSLNQYKIFGQPICVSFRRLVDWLSSPDRVTHLIHPYPAKLLMHIPHFFLANDILSQKGDIVLDPFSGTGTVLLESLLTGKNAIGADSNPLARLISKVKTTPIHRVTLNNAINTLIENIPSKPHINPPDVVNLEKWFYPHVIKQLVCILEAIKITKESDVKDFFLLCFSKCLRSVSLADPRLTVPVKLRIDKYPEEHWFYQKAADHLKRIYRINVTSEFIRILKENANKIDALGNLLTHKVSAKIICSDARNLQFEFFHDGNFKNKLPNESIQFIITSPPYAGAQKYIRSSSLSLGWLEMCTSKELRSYEEATIGREHYHKIEYSEPVITGIEDADNVLSEIYKINPLRGHIAANYLKEMEDALIEAHRVLKRNGYIVIVISNNTICGKDFNSKDYIKCILDKLGFKLLLVFIDDIRSRGLMTKRNTTANIITKEWALLLQKN